MPYNEKTIQQLDSLPLPSVMEANGYAAAFKTATSVFYRCPFHDDKDASFSVERFPRNGHSVAGFHCFGCEANSKESDGRGAITLQMRLNVRSGNIEPGKSNWLKAQEDLAKKFNLILEGEHLNNRFHRREAVSAQEGYTFQEKPGGTPFTHEELRALGCQVQQVYTSGTHRGEEGSESVRDEKNNPIYKYSFGKDFYRRDCPGNNFNPEQLKELFSLYSLESFTTPAEKEKDGIGMISYRYDAKPHYPIFFFRYEDEKGWWGRKYEPLFKQTRDKSGKLSPNYKFTWHWQDGKKRTDLGGMVYGDKDVMEALKTGVVASRDEEGHPTVNAGEKENGQYITKRKFKRIIICSGPRDAINVYFHSDAHVVFPHSESTEISDAVMQKLFSIGAEVFVLYDIDKTGITQMHRLAFRYLHLKVIYLPEDLKEEENPRSGKACKDAEEFFNFYPRVMARDEQKAADNVNNRFKGLLKTAKWMQFWDVSYSQPKGEDGEKGDVIRKYSINFENATQFLAANGFYVYKDESGNKKYVLMKNNIVDIIDEKEAMSEVRRIMKEFLEYNYRHYRLELVNAIATQKRVSGDSLRNIKETKLNFVSWGEDYEYFFFRNTAVKVTADAITPVAYKDLDFHVNRKAIMDYDYRSGLAPLFEITENPDFQRMKERYAQDMARPGITDTDRTRLTSEFTDNERLWRFKLRFTEKEEDRCPALQYLYDISRIHWRKQETGLHLTVDEKQRQDMHFISKANAIGYVLHRFRTRKLQQMVVFTDYSVRSESTSSGGTGKSTVESLIEQVRKVRHINGKSFKRKDNMPKNFQEFRDTEDSMFFIDDLRGDILDEDFYNITERITVKTLYNNEMTLTPERTPKIFITTNKSSFDHSNPSTRRRIMFGWVSDYYHPVSEDGRERERTIATKFGKDIILNATKEERLQTALMMMQCCQFHLRIQNELVAPLEGDALNRQMYSAIRDEVFIEWANRYFENPWHFERPLSRKEIIKDYLDYRGEEVTRSSIRRNKKKFFEAMEIYCRHNKYVMNPEITKRADTSSDAPRRKAWETVFAEDRPNKSGIRRVTDTSVPVCYFYRLEDVPKVEAQVLGVPETDEEKKFNEKEE